ncbi:MAG TPA: hypothetical protein VGS62_09835 [Streptosporangiaceae bacterium]|nr:hypothetical protein [Streptosporangiaceae bacterium]
MDTRPLRALSSGFMWSRRSFPFWFFGLLVVAIVAHSLALGAIWLAVMAGYVISVLIHPRARCTRCGGSGELRGSVYSWAFRKCPDCQGGRIIRRGATALGLPHVRQQAAQNRETQKNTKTRQRW